MILVGAWFLILLINLLLLLIKCDWWRRTHSLGFRSTKDLFGIFFLKDIGSIQNIKCIIDSSFDVLLPFLDSIIVDVVRILITVLLRWSLLLYLILILWHLFIIWILAQFSIWPKNFLSSLFGSSKLFNQHICDIAVCGRAQVLDEIFDFLAKSLEPPHFPLRIRHLLIFFVFIVIILPLN